MGTCHATAAAPLPVAGGFPGPPQHVNAVPGPLPALRLAPVGDDAYLMHFPDGPPASLSG